jgi:hypothetical protein
LDIIQRKREVGPYLEYYLRLVDVDRRCILLDEPMSCHLIMQQEDLIHLLVIGFKRLAILLRRVVEGRFDDDVVLIEVGSVGVRASFLYG